MITDGDSIAIILAAVLLLEGGWLLIRNILRKKRQHEEEEHNDHVGKPDGCTCIWFRSSYTNEYEMALRDVHCTHHGVGAKE